MDQSGILACTYYADQKSSKMAESTPSPAEDENYDLVIEGTGLTESILAAAASWVGKKVLHVDKNSFYGSHWAALSLNEIDVWAQNNVGAGTVTSHFHSY
jgi:RAB protein geranylgeranyltransferase component A